jgi:hypothetical protein
MINNAIFNFRTEWNNQFFKINESSNSMQYLFNIFILSFFWLFLAETQQTPVIVERNWPRV